MEEVFPLSPFQELYRGNVMAEREIPKALQQAREAFPTSSTKVHRKGKGGKSRFFYFPFKFFEKGVGENFFQKSFPPPLFMIPYYRPRLM